MFATALIVFRESLEAALFIGIVAAATRGLAGRSRWLAGGVFAGVAGAAALALAAQAVASALDGLGTDLVNAIVLSAALLMLLWHCIVVATHGREMAAEARNLGQGVRSGGRAPWALSAAVALAVLREGAETLLFVGGTMNTEGAASPAATVLAGLTGLAAGAAVGAAIYAGLTRIPVRHVFTVTNTMIALLAASLASQLARTLAQAGWLETGTQALWDSSAWLAPESALGTLLHALVGYDARPSATQLLSWAAALLLIVAGTRWMQHRAPSPR